MNILFLYISLPHLSESGVFNDLIKEFHRNGHNVKVATPSNSDEKTGVYKEAEIDVLRFKTNQLTRNTSNIQKGLNYIKFIPQCLSAINKFYKKEKFDLIISHSLPPEIGIVIRSLKRKYKSKFYLMLCEYIWQDSVSLGFIRENGLVKRYYQFLERLLIKQAEYIGCPSQGNIDFVLRYYPWADRHNLHVLHYAQYPIELEAEKIDVREKFNITNKVLVIYGGNMTIAQKIQNVIDVAESCSEYTDIVFLLLGRGPQMEEIKSKVIDKKLKNIIFINFLPQNEYNLLLSSCDIGLVSLNERLAIPNIPSKTLSYFNLSVPIVASIDKSTDYGSYLERAGGGLW